ncbi:Disease resistance protein RPM1 [Hordeum vulgare]|nr:Disease resistance protein RPM1 [Hordeum vulgare]
MSTDSEGWQQQMEALIGMSPPEPEAADGGKKYRVPTGAPFTWIATNFANCPQDANEDVIETYAHVYMWYVISRTIFADDSGKNTQWMWLKALTDFDHKFSWGSAALAYLYRLVHKRRWNLVVVCSYFRYGLGNAFLLDAVERWFQENSRVEICPPDFPEDILEDPTSFDELAHVEYNKLIREGYQMPFAPVLNILCKEIKKQETQHIEEKRENLHFDVSSRNRARSCVAYPTF